MKKKSGLSFISGVGRVLLFHFKRVPVELNYPVEFKENPEDFLTYHKLVFAVFEVTSTVWTFQNI